MAINFRFNDTKLLMYESSARRRRDAKPGATHGDGGLRIGWRSMADRPVVCGAAGRGGAVQDNRTAGGAHGKLRIRKSHSISTRGFQDT